MKSSTLNKAQFAVLNYANENHVYKTGKSYHLPNGNPVTDIAYDLIRRGFLEDYPIPGTKIAKARLTSKGLAVIQGRVKS